MTPQIGTLPQSRNHAPHLAAETLGNPGRDSDSTGASIATSGQRTDAEAERRDACRPLSPCCLLESLLTFVVLPAGPFCLVDFHPHSGYNMTDGNPTPEMWGSAVLHG